MQPAGFADEEVVSALSQGGPEVPDQKQVRREAEPYVWPIAKTTVFAAVAAPFLWSLVIAIMALVR